MQYTSITADQLRTIATLKHAASKDEVTPIIMGIQITATEQDLTAYTTDRYRCAEYTAPLSHDIALPATTPRTAFEAIVPPSLIDQVVKMLPRISTAGASIAVTHDEATHSITFASTVGEPFTVGGSTIQGNYPPLRRLFPADGAVLDGAGPMRLNSAFLGALDKIMLTRLGRGHRFWEMGLQPKTDSSQPPVVFTMQDDAHRIRVLIQPSYRR